MKDKTAATYTYTIEYTLHDVVENKDIDHGRETVSVGWYGSETDALLEKVKAKNPTIPTKPNWLNPFSRYRLYTNIKHCAVTH